MKYNGKEFYKHVAFIPIPLTDTVHCVIMHFKCNSELLCFN